MANLWRILAVAWLGGIASPALMDEPAPAVAPPPVMVAVQIDSEMGQTAREAVQRRRDAGDQQATDDGL